MTKWRAKIEYVAALDMFHMSIWAGKKWHFVYDFKPCDNLYKFFKGLTKEEEYITWVINTGREL